MLLKERPGSLHLFLATRTEFRVDRPGPQVRSLNTSSAAAFRLCWATAKRPAAGAKSSWNISARTSRPVGIATPAWEKLRAVRTRLAQANGAPAYFILHDSHLRALCHHRPQKQVSGWGCIKHRQCENAYSLFDSARVCSPCHGRLRRLSARRPQRFADTVCQR